MTEVADRYRRREKAGTSDLPASAESGDPGAAFRDIRDAVQRALNAPDTPTPVPVPEDALLQDRALGLIGRDPRWAPPT